MILIRTIVAVTDEHEGDSDEEGGDEYSHDNKNLQLDHYSIYILYIGLGVL